jgi:hypothetical protein
VAWISYIINRNGKNMSKRKRRRDKERVVNSGLQRKERRVRTGWLCLIYRLERISVFFFLNKKKDKRGDTKESKQKLIYRQKEKSFGYWATVQVINELK